MHRYLESTMAETLSGKRNKRRKTFGRAGAVGRVACCPCSIGRLDQLIALKRSHARDRPLFYPPIVILRWFNRDFLIDGTTRINLWSKMGNLGPHAVLKDSGAQTITSNNALPNADVMCRYEAMASSNIQGSATGRPGACYSFNPRCFLWQQRAGYFGPARYRVCRLRCKVAYRQFYLI